MDSPQMRFRSDLVDSDVPPFLNLDDDPASHNPRAALAVAAAPPAGFVNHEPHEMGGGGGGGTSSMTPSDATRTALVQPNDATPFYKTRKFMIIQSIVAGVGIILLFVFLFPVVRAIAQLVVNRSVVNIDTAAIIQPQNTSFQLHLQGLVTHTGIFNAKIAFIEPIQVAWVNGAGQNQTVVHLGQMNFSVLDAKSKRATINQTTVFMIDDEQAFGEFTGAMITQPNFTWRLTSDNLRVNALSFPTANGIKFSKDITLNGINNFDGHVKLLDFQLPHDDAQGGISFKAVTNLNNTSPFNVDLGNVVFNLTYQDVFLGQGMGANTFVAPGPNSIELDGRLVSHNSSSTELGILGTLFSNYLNSVNSFVIAQGVSTMQSDGTAVSWLSAGLTRLRLEVPFVPAQPINPIRAIEIGSFNLSFTPDTAWGPLATSDDVHASLVLPFGFDLKIGEIANSFAIVQNESIVANLSTPLGASKSAIRVLSPTDTEGEINITLANTPLQVPVTGHTVFSTFNEELTKAKVANFRLVGKSRAVSDLPIGRITLDPIMFDVPSSLNGLQGLQGSTVIDGVDVMGGTSDHMNLNINVSIFNPSNLNLNTGDLSLQLLRGGAVLGTTLLPNLSLAMGNNTLAATSEFRPNDSPQGMQTLGEFVSGKDVLLNIAGYSGSTKVASLLQAFESLNITATLPALKSSLLQSSSLKILDTTGKTNNVAHVTVNLNNPFSAALMITKINSTIKSHGLNLGTIETETHFPAGGHAMSTSPVLDLNMNLDPPTIFTLLRRLAVQSGENTAQLDQIVAIGGYKYVASTNDDNKALPSRRLAKRGNIFSGFDLTSYVDKAFKQLQTDIELQSVVSIGDYQTTLGFTQPAVPVATDESLNLLLPLLAHPIVQKIIDGSVLGIDRITITNPQETSFDTILSGSISNSGPFDAAIDFGDGLHISWNGKQLGSLAMPKVQVVGDVGAQLNLTASFKVADVDHLTSFTKVLLTEPSFEWAISGENLTVSALGMSVPGVILNAKTVTLKGMNGLKNGVVINSFNLPSNDPAGGVHLTLETTVTNPSQVGVQLSSIGFNNFVGQTLLGPAASAGPFTLAPEASIKLPLAGRLIHQDSNAGLATVSKIFTDFIHGVSTNVVVVGDSAGPSGVSWLNTAIKSLQVSTVLPTLGPLNVIKSIGLEQLELDFTPETAYDPSTSSNAATAAFQLPFTFPVDIVAVEQNITASLHGQSFAQLAVPKGPSQTDVANRIIHLAFSKVPFAVFGDKHQTFQQFLAETTKASSETFQLAGAANTDANTAIGLLSLSGISFSVSTTIAGLQGLNAKPAIVSNLDVNHGFPDFLLIKVTTTLLNPSNLTISMGDVSFALNFENQVIGKADISGLKLIPGSAPYATDVHFQPQGGAQAAGRTLLQNFLQGINSSTTIVGSSDSTAVNSLVPALEAIQLNANIPALQQNLITATHIEFPTDIVKTGIASSTVDLANPFTASINLLVITATAKFENLLLGTVDHVDASANPVHVPGHSKITSPALPLKFNLQPLAIIELLSIRAQQKGIDLGPLIPLFQAIVQNPNFHPPITATVDPNPPTCVSGKQFDVAGAVLNALAGLEVTLDVDSVVKLDDFKTELAFTQKNVPAITDKTALFLIGAVAPPVVQLLVDQATLSFSIANITNVSEEGFDLSLEGQLVNTGPLDAQITFVEPIQVTWQNRNIATITLPAVCAAANVGVPDYKTQGRLAITDAKGFTDFATSLLHDPDFTWTISTKKLRVTALGTIFDGVTLSKSISFKAFNGLPGVTISNFNLPHDDPAGGITISTDSLIPSPAQLGIQLGTVTFDLFFNNVPVGPVAGDNLFLAAATTTREHLTGRMLPQSGQNLETIGVLFSKFLAGENQTLVVQGNTVDPSGHGQSVSWLSTAFRTLKLQVTLPGQVFKIIDSITIEDLELEMIQPSEDFAPLTSSKTTLATFKNPFGFSLQVLQASEHLTIGASGIDVASLDVPMTETNSGVSTGNIADLMIHFEKQPLRSLANSIFPLFFAEVTDAPSADMTLKGTTNILARTAIGNVPISAIPFNVPSSIKGINSFGRTTTLSNISIIGSGGNGGNQFIRTPLTTALQNPSNISLLTNDIALPVFFKGVQLGRTAINNFALVPGENSVPAEFHYEPENANDTVAQSFLASFLTTSDLLPLTIKGDAASTPHPSLQLALEGVELATSLNGANARILTHINVFITPETLVTNMVSIDFDVFNPTDADLVIEFVQADGSVNGEIFAHFDQAFDSFVVPPKQSANSGTFGNVLLTQGALKSLGIIPLGKLDVAAAETVRVGRGGYAIPWLQVFQGNVPTTYHLNIGGLASLPLPALEQAVSSMIHSSAAPSSGTQPPHGASSVASSDPSSPGPSGQVQSLHGPPSTATSIAIEANNTTASS